MTIFISTKILMGQVGTLQFQVFRCYPLIATQLY